MPMEKSTNSIIRTNGLTKTKRWYPKKLSNNN